MTAVARRPLFTGGSAFVHRPFTVSGLARSPSIPTVRAGARGSHATAACSRAQRNGVLSVNISPSAVERSPPRSPAPSSSPPVAATTTTTARPRPPPPRRLRRQRPTPAAPTTTEGGTDDDHGSSDDHRGRPDGHHRPDGAGPRHAHRCRRLVAGRRHAGLAGRLPGGQPRRHGRVRPGRLRRRPRARSSPAVPTSPAPTPTSTTRSYEASIERCAGDEGAIDLPHYISPIVVAYNLPDVDGR